MLSQSQYIFFLLFSNFSYPPPLVGFSSSSLIPHFLFLPFVLFHCFLFPPTLSHLQWLSLLSPPLTFHPVSSYFPLLFPFPTHNCSFSLFVFLFSFSPFITLLRFLYSFLLFTPKYNFKKLSKNMSCCVTT